MNDIREQLRRQIVLEEEGKALGASRYHSRKLPWNTEAGSIDEESNLPPGKRLLKILIDPTAEAIEEFLAQSAKRTAGRGHSAAPFLMLGDSKEMAYLTARVVINHSVNQSTLQVTALAVADAIVENLEYTAFHLANKIGYKGFLAQQQRRGYSRQRRDAVRKLFVNEGVRIESPRADRASAGAKLIELLLEATGMFTRERIKKKKGYVIVIRPAEVLQKWLDEQHARCALLDPINMPMIIRPRRWRTPFHGGYITYRPGTKLVKQRNKSYHEELRNVEMPEVYSAVNHIQETAWRINRNVLDVMDTLWKVGRTVGGLPPREPLPIPSKPADIDTNEEALARWKRQAAEVYQANAGMVSQRISMHQKLWVARKFVSEPQLFFPHELDFRGRVYPSAVQGPSPQGDDTAKALLEFAEGKPLGPKGGLWLTIHMANLFGVDKVAYQDRVDWTWAHSDELVACADDPYENRLWTTADSPFCALAACFEWKGFIEQGDDYVSRIPIALDGSCSGLQHFSAMLRDRTGGEAVNLTASSEPQDVYDEVRAKCETLIAASPDLEAGYWAGKVSRKIAKRPTMTYSYSATRFGMQGMILQTLRELDKASSEPYLGGEDNYEAAMWLSHVMWKAIGEVVVAASNAMEWLREAAKVAASAELPLWWTTPQGLPVLQEYKKMVGKRLNVHWAGQRIQLMLTKETDKLDKRGQCNGVAPNFVHSLDASHLMAVANECKDRGINHIAVIHDSFGTHAADTDTMADILRDTFIDQYKPDILRQFRDELAEQLPPEIAAKLPPLPGYGDLDLNEIRASSYIFA